MTARTAPVTGRRLCGAATCEITGPIKWTVYFHCESCRRSTGGAVSNFIGVKPADLQWTGAQPAAFASWPEAERRFRSVCGASLTYRSAALTVDVGVHIGALDHPVRVTPERHVAAEERLPCLHLAAGLPGGEGPEAT